jgi:hypothetical protein
MKKPPEAKIATPTGESAEVLAITILTWLSDQPSLMGRFLAISGIEPGHIRQLIGDPGFSGGLTGFLMAHEPTLLQFCQENDIKVEWVQACHHHFTGPNEGAWL